MRILINGGWVVGFEQGHHTLIANGSVLIEGNKVVFVGKDFGGEADLTIDAKDKLVSPGFIDTHVHAGHRASHKLITDVGRKDYYGQPALETSVAREGTRVAGEPRFLRPGDSSYNTDIDGPAEFTLVELLRNGVTTFVEFGSAMPVQMALIRMLSKYKLRAYLGSGYDSGRWVADERGRLKRILDEAGGLRGYHEGLDFALKQDGAQDGRIRTTLMPRTFETCSAELLNLTREAAEKHGLPIGIHVAFSVLEFNDTIRIHQKTPLSAFTITDFLDPR